MNNTPRMLSWSLTSKRVFVRTDLNTALGHVHFNNSLKFKRLLLTLTYLKQQGARVTLATHLGRPHGFEPELSTRPLAHYFQEAGFSCAWSTVPELEKTLSEHHDIILLENLRFYADEDTNSISFAKKITQDAHFFVEDGFGVLAREDTSVTTAAELFGPEDRSIGLAVEYELKRLNPLKDNVKKPYLVMIGGGKGPEKLETLYNFFDKVTHIALCPGVSEQKEVKNFIKRAQENNVNILMPLDYIEQKASIGLETYRQWQPIITEMRTIVYSGLMGFVDKPDTLTITQQLFELFDQSDAQVVLAGGDTTLAAQAWGLENSTNIILSTGGGSTLTYLSGQPLPGLEVIRIY